MTVIYLTKQNTKCYGVTFKNNECLKVQNFEDISIDENTILNRKAIETFLDKSHGCDMNAMSRASDKSLFDGNSNLLKISEEIDRHRNIYFGGIMVSCFLTNDNIYEYISNMRNNLTPYSIAVGDIYFLTPRFSFIKKDKIVERELLNTYESSVDPFDYHISKCGKETLKKMQIYKIHSNYD